MIQICWHFQQISSWQSEHNYEKIDYEKMTFVFVQIKKRMYI